MDDLLTWLDPLVVTGIWVSTSNVDFGSDGRVMDALLELECTLLINAHRLHHIRRLVRIRVIARVRVGQGPPLPRVGYPSPAVPPWVSAALPCAVEARTPKQEIHRRCAPPLL